MICVMLANGFEEIEAFAPVDILRRAELDVLTVGIGGKTVRGAHGITVAADLSETEVRDKHLSALVLPGGMPGTLHLERSDTVQRLLDAAVERELYGAKAPWQHDEEHYAFCGGGFPLYVNGEFRGAAIISGLPHLKDHALLCETVKTYWESKKK